MVTYRIVRNNPKGYKDVRNRPAHELHNLQVCCSYLYFRTPEKEPVNV